MVLFTQTAARMMFAMQKEKIRVPCPKSRKRKNPKQQIRDERRHDSEQQQQHDEAGGGHHIQMMS
jgi:hypothetical protein